jgi:hypothetical protein
MPKALYLQGTDRLIARLTDRQFATLQGALQAESPSDRDWFVNDATLRLLEAKGCDAALVARLRSWVRGEDGADEPPKRAPTGYRAPHRPDQEVVVTEAAPSVEAGIDVEWREDE